MKKKIVHITTVHNVRDSRIFFRECLSLAKHYQTIIIAPSDNNDRVDGIEIVSLGTFKSRLHRICGFQLKALRLALSLKADLYHFHDPELVPTGILLKLLGHKVIYDVHEDVPKDILLKTYIPSVLRLPLSYLAKGFERMAGYVLDSIITVTPDIAKRFPPKKVNIVKNYPFLPKKKIDLEQYQKRRNDLIYIGSINESRGLKEMILTASELKRSLILIGNMPVELQKSYIKNQPNDGIQYMPWMLSPKLSAYLDNSKIGLLLLHPMPTFLTSYPLKLFEYMAAGLPVIASNFPEWRLIVEKHQCGLLVDPLDINAIKEAAAYLLANPKQAYQMGQNGMEAIKKTMNWENESLTLLNIYDHILGSVDI